MTDTERLANNIRKLRLAFGETQKELGDAIHIKDNMISYFETGERKPSHDTIIAIAKHYGITVEELLYQDFSDLKGITVDRFALWRNLDSVLPLICSEEALQNDSFRRAHQYHAEMYELLKRDDYSGFYYYDKCINQYQEAGDDESIQEEVAANLIAFLYLVRYWTYCPEIIKVAPAALRQTIKRDERARITLENTDPSFEKDAKEAKKELDESSYDEGIKEMQNLLKHSSKYSELGDYYLALQYAWNIVENELPLEFNLRVGAEMMSTLISVGNPYAARFMQVQLEMSGVELNNL